MPERLRSCCAWLCLAVSLLRPVCARLCLAVPGCAWLCLAAPGRDCLDLGRVCAWLCVARRGRVWVCLAAPRLRPAHAPTAPWLRDGCVLAALACAWLRLAALACALTVSVLCLAVACCVWPRPGYAMAEPGCAMANSWRTAALRRAACLAAPGPGCAWLCLDSGCVCDWFCEMMRLWLGLSGCAPTAVWLRTDRALAAQLLRVGCAELCLAASGCAWLHSRCVLSAPACGGLCLVAP